MTVQQLVPALLFDSNIYLVAGSERTVLIDTGTGFKADETVKSLREVLAGRKLDYVVLTHRHFDHVGGMGRIISEFSPSAVYAGAKDAEPLRRGDSDSTLGTKFGGKIVPTAVTVLKDGDIIDLGDHRLRCIETPGHTAGSICLLDDSTGDLFSGDTVFIGGVGNTDYPTASLKDLVLSVRKLANLEVNGLYPGHGPSVATGGREQIDRDMKGLGGVLV
jgi:hydroxyacylglutathione hydrolase